MEDGVQEYLKKMPEKIFASEKVVSMLEVSGTYYNIKNLPY
jgi:hypothetical protein